MMSSTIQFLAAILLPGVLTALMAWLMARSAKLDETRYIDEPHRGCLFSLLSVAIAAPIAWLLDPIGGSILNNVPRGVIPGAIYLLFVLPCGVGPLADKVYLGIIRRRLRERQRMRRCLHCDYDLTGNTTGRCPECGTVIEETIVMDDRRA